MMIASLGMAMIMRGILYLRYGAEQFLFVPDVDWRLSSSALNFLMMLKLNHFMDIGQSG